MEVFLILLAIIGVCLIVIKVCEDADYNSQREYNGKRYRYQEVGMDVDTSYRDMMKTYTNELSLQEYKKRTNKKSYAICAWVEVGKSPYTWKDDPINRDIYFRYAHDTETLPKYLQNESGCMTVKQYREKSR